MESPDLDARNLLARAESLSAPGVTIRRAEARNKAAALTYTFANGGYGGSDHKAALRAFCTAELHHRAGMHLDAVLGCHKAMSGSPADSVRRAVKDWTANRIVEEARDLEAVMPGTNVAWGETGEPPHLNEEAKREIAASSAAADSEFDRLHRAYVERAWRFLVRSAKVFRLGSGQL